MPLLYSSLDIGTVVHLTATKLQSFMLSVPILTFCYAMNIRRRSLFIADQVGQSAVCLGTEPPTRTHDQTFAFSEFCDMEFVGRHPCRDDGSVFFVLSAFTSIITLLLLGKTFRPNLYLAQSVSHTQFAGRCAPWKVTNGAENFVSKDPIR
jgi:hypothetical protein